MKSLLAFLSAHADVIFYLVAVIWVAGLGKLSQWLGGKSFFGAAFLSRALHYLALCPAPRTLSEAAKDAEQALERAAQP